MIRPVQCCRLLDGLVLVGVDFLVSLFGCEQARSKREASRSSSCSHSRHVTSIPWACCHDRICTRNGTLGMSMDGLRGCRVMGQDASVPWDNHSNMAARSKVCPYLEINGSDITPNVNGQTNNDGMTVLTSWQAACFSKHIWLSDMMVCRGRIVNSLNGGQVTQAVETNFVRLSSCIVWTRATKRIFFLTLVWWLVSTSTSSPKWCRRYHLSGIVRETICPKLLDLVLKCIRDRNITTSATKRIT